MRASETRKQQKKRLLRCVKKGGGTVRVVVRWRPATYRRSRTQKIDLVRQQQRTPTHTKRRANDASIVVGRARYVNGLGAAFSFHVRRTPARVERRLPGAGAVSNCVPTLPRGATNESAREAILVHNHFILQNEQRAIVCGALRRRRAAAAACCVRSATNDSALRRAPTVAEKASSPTTKEREKKS